MRTILAIIYVLFYLIISIPFLLVELLTRKIDPVKTEIRHLHVVQWGLRCVAFISGTKINVIGLDNIPTDQAVLYVGNHQSIFDVVVAYSLVPTRTGFVAKKSMEKIPLLSTHMKRIHCLFLDRNNLRDGMRMIKEAIAMIGEGVSVFIFPEGTRNKSGDELQLGEFHDGSLKIAQRAKCPIVPVAINNTEPILEANFPWVKSQKVTIEFGKPILYADLSPEDQKHPGEYFKAIVHDTLEKNRA